MIMGKKNKMFVDISIRNNKNQKVATKSMSMDIEEYKEVVRLFKIR